MTFRKLLPLAGGAEFGSSLIAQFLLTFTTSRAVDQNASADILASVVLDVKALPIGSFSFSELTTQENNLGCVFGHRDAVFAVVLLSQQLGLVQ